MTLPAPDLLVTVFLALEQGLAPRRAMRRPMAATGMDGAVLELLLRDGPTSLPDLFARFRGVSLPEEVVESLNRLGDAGWLANGPQGPNRIQSAEVTDLGREGHAAVLAWRAELQEEAMRGLSEEERARLAALLGRVAANLTGAAGRG